MRWLFLVSLWLLTLLLPKPALAAPFAPAEAAHKSPLDDVGKKKEEEKAKLSAAEEEAERKRKEKLARVVVLKWPGTPTNHRDETLQRNIKSRIARPEANFFPEVDLYQNGRKVKDKTVVPAMQPAVVPAQNVDRVRQAVDEVSALPWNAMPPDEWGIKAQGLRELVELIWFIDRVDLREPLFLLYAQIGRAAENQNNAVPPFYEEIGNLSVNYYFFLAATMAHQDPALLSKLTDQDLNGAISAMLQQLQQGVFPTLRLDFELEGEDFDLEGYLNEYETFLNGLPIEPDEQGRFDVFYGRSDIYLRRKDTGHGLSERLEVAKFEDNFFFVRENARKKMGKDFIEQLFLHPNECTPELDGDILNFLAIYAKLHEKAEIYIAVPKEGNPNKVWIWRYDRSQAALQLVAGGNDSFPVRFAILAAAGIMYNSITVEYETSIVDSANPSEDINSVTPVPSELIDYDLKPAYIPINLELRGHYNRLMVATGWEFGFNTGGDKSDGGFARWVERYYTPGVEGREEADDVVVIGVDKGGKTETRTDSNEDGVIDDRDAVTTVSYEGQEVLHDVRVNRNRYLAVGVVFGRDAAIGFGPRLALRIGATNVPFALQTTAHFGWTIDPPVIGTLGDRVRPFVDFDLRGGASWPFKYSLAHTKDPITVGAVYGITLGIGTTF